MHTTRALIKALLGVWLLISLVGLVAAVLMPLSEDRPGEKTV
jgi:uncharacterized membrane protein